MGEEIEELWDGLNLGGLLNDLQRENDALVKAQRMKVINCQSTVHSLPLFRILSECTIK
jgi:hypothetical protein